MTDVPGLTSQRYDRRLVIDLGEEHEVVSWALVGGGLGRAREVVWLEVRDADLPRDRDPVAFLAERLADAGHAGAVGLLTSADLARVTQARAAERDDDGLAVADVVATVGLRNGRRIGDAPGSGTVGTINVLCRVTVPLTVAARLEALTLVAEARTTAVLEAQIPSPVSGRPITGTGTDCIVLASAPAPADAPASAYAGKHTAVGAAIGRATEDAIVRALAGRSR